MIFDKKIKPSLFKNGIKTCVLELLASNKGQFFTIKKIRENIMEKRPFIYDYRCILFLAFSGGIVGKITASIHNLREDGYPIVSSAEFGKGYAMIDPDDYMSPDYWDSKFLANEKREDIPKTERLVDERLFIQCLEKCTNPTIRQKLKVIAETHKVKLTITENKKEKKGDSLEDEMTEENEDEDEE